MSAEEAVVQKTGRAGPIVQLLAAPFSALSFLTVLPVPVPGSAGRLSMGWAVACFPLAGAFMGLCLVGMDWLLSPWFPPAVEAALLLVALLAATGALHLDGFMDSFDGVFGGKDPASRRAIMKDSRVGSFGIAAAASALLLEYGSLASLPAAGRVEALVLAVALSRWAMAALLWLFPAAGSTGLAAGLKPQVRWVHVVVATILAVAIAASFPGWAGGILVVLSGLAVLAVGRLMVAKIGGITGDSCGAVGQLVEILVLVASAAIVR
jgi:adenosylcobinamide-GDP ribazoletransferase